MTAHRFQEQYTGIQIYVWHCNTKEIAIEKFRALVINPDNWIVLGTITI